MVVRIPADLQQVVKRSDNLPPNTSKVTLIFSLSHSDASFALQQVVFITCAWVWVWHPPLTPPLYLFDIRGVVLGARAIVFAQWFGLLMLKCWQQPPAPDPHPTPTHPHYSDGREYVRLSPPLSSHYLVVLCVQDPDRKITFVMWDHAFEVSSVLQLKDVFGGPVLGCAGLGCAGLGWAILWCEVRNHMATVCGLQV